MYNDVINELKKEGVTKLVSDKTINSQWVNRIWKNMNSDFIDGRYVLHI